MPLDPEIMAMVRIERELRKLSPKGALRVVQWALSRSEELNSEMIFHKPVMPLPVPDPVEAEPEEPAAAPVEPPPAPARTRKKREPEPVFEHRHDLPI